MSTPTTSNKAKSGNSPKPGSSPKPDSVQGPYSKATPRGTPPRSKTYTASKADPGLGYTYRSRAPSDEDDLTPSPERQNSPTPDASKQRSTNDSLKASSSDAAAVAEALAKSSIQDNTAKKDELPKTYATVYQYDLRVIGRNGEISGALKKEICKAFSKEVFLGQTPEGVSKVSSRSFMTTKVLSVLGTKYVMNLQVTDDEKIKSARSAEYVKIRGQADDGKSATKWALTDTVMLIPKEGQLTPLPKGVNAELAKAVRAWASTTNSQDISNEQLMQYANEKHASVTKHGKDGEHWTDTVVIFAERTEMCIGPMLNIADSGAKGSALAQAVNFSMLNSDIKPADLTVSLSLGNRVFEEAKSLDCGLEVRQGFTLKPVITSDDVKMHVDKKPCTQHLFRQILVSDFLTSHFGPSGISCDATKAEELSKMLKGIKVTVATSKGSKTCNIRGVTHKSVHMIPINLAGSDGPITLGELYEKHYGKQLRYPTMPCIDLGYGDREYFVPAEACLLVKDQPFNHKVPFYATEKNFTQGVKERKPSVAKVGEPGFPFTNVEASNLDVLFAEVTIEPGMGRQPDMDRQWSIFRDALKTRFGGKIAESIRNDELVKLHYVLSKDKSQSSTATWAADLRKAVGIKAARTVVVVAIPAGKHNASIYNELKTICDTEIGVQCKVIRTNVLSKVVRGTDQELKVFTGAIVRNLLARTLHPAEAEKKASTLLEKKEVVAKGALLGVHVQPVEMSKVKNMQEQIIATEHLITITSSAVSEPADVYTTHHLVSTSEGNLAADQVVESLAEHTQKRYTASSHAVLYRSGTGADDRSQALDEMKKALGGIKQGAFVAYAAEKLLQLDSNSETLELDGLATTTDMGHLLNPFGLRSDFGKTYARDAKQVQEATRTYLLTHGQLSEERCRTVIANTSLPDILYLAQEASKYAQRYLEKVGDQIQLKEIKEELRGTLYYI
ncbi:hypothetical protein LTR17_003559 [Elasticomyces elasticus]|nr:hypothetical protein LTR17_003559 [Elasticomyces elasticus]